LWGKALSKKTAGIGLLGADRKKKKKKDRGGKKKTGSKRRQRGNWGGGKVQKTLQNKTTKNHNTNRRKEEHLGRGPKIKGEDWGGRGGLRFAKDGKFGIRKGGARLFGHDHKKRAEEKKKKKKSYFVWKRLKRNQALGKGGKKKKRLPVGDEMLGQRGSAGWRRDKEKTSQKNCSCGGRGKESLTCKKKQKGGGECYTNQPKHEA